MTSVAIRTGTAQGRWVVAAAVLGSGVAFLDSTVVNVALPAIARDFDTDLASLQWVVTAYLLTLGSLLVLGGSLGDLYGRRRTFLIGLVGFDLTSALCGLAPSAPASIAARALQGVTAALLVPGSLAIISSSFHPADRSRAVGAWSGLAGVTSAIGPFLGGFLVDAVSWRWVFLINAPIVLVAVVVTMVHVPETVDPDRTSRVDWWGATALSGGLAGVVYALIEQPGQGWSGPVLVALLAGVALLVAFPVIETRSTHPMVPLAVFRNSQFSGANLVTFAVYAALGAATTLTVLQLQLGLGYSALAAGMSLLPITVIMLAFSARSGALAQRIGPRPQMTIGPIVVGLGLYLLGRVEPGVTYLSGVFPGVVVLGAGLALTVAPLTAAVLAAIDDRHAGIGSAINNAVARIASLLAIALLPALAGIDTSTTDLSLGTGYRTAVYLAAGLAMLGGVVAAFTIRKGAAVPPMTQPVANPCQDPCVQVSAEAA